MNDSWDRTISITVRTVLYTVSTVALAVLLGNTQKAWIAATGLGMLVVICVELSLYFNKRNKNRSFGENRSIPSLRQSVIVGVLSSHVDDYFASEYLANNPHGIESRRKTPGLVGRVVGILEDNSLSDGTVILVSFALAGPDGKRLPYILDELKQA